MFPVLKGRSVSREGASKACFLLHSQCLQHKKVAVQFSRDLLLLSHSQQHIPRVPAPDISFSSPVIFMCHYNEDFRFRTPFPASSTHIHNGFFPGENF